MDIFCTHLYTERDTDPLANREANIDDILVTRLSTYTTEEIKSLQALHYIRVNATEPGAEEDGLTSVLGRRDWKFSFRWILSYYVHNGNVKHPYI